MRIGYAVGSLGRGGAELQLIQLATGLARRGHDVSVLAYDGASEVDHLLTQEGVVLERGSGGGRVAKVRAARRWFRGFRPAVVHGVMKRASVLSLFARVPGRRPAIVATDMSSATYGRRGPVLWAALAAFGSANCVVTQTEMNRVNLERMAPWLKGKTRVIRNGLDTERFRPGMPATLPPARPFRFVVAGTVYPVKNPAGVLEAVAELRRRGCADFEVAWHGRLSLDEADTRPNPFVDQARRLGLDDVVRFHGATGAIESAYGSADALLHASVQEGFPNVVAEGMACGLPIVVSRVSDLPTVVSEAKNGYVFDASDPMSIADAMEHMMRLSDDERQAMRCRSRETAVRWFGMDRFLDEFEALYGSLVGKDV